MAFFDCHFFSETLGLSVSAHVLLPQPTTRQIGMPGATGPAPAGGFPTLTLLHGLSDDHTIWMRRTSIERYAAAKNLAVVMPAVGRSFYQDLASGPAYWTFLSEELPLLMRGFFPLSSARDSNFVAGLSMGGYGALRLALTHPARFAAVASLSGALDVARICREGGRPGSRLTKPEVQNLFGPDLKAAGTPLDLFTLAETFAKKPAAPDKPIENRVGKPADDPAESPAENLTAAIQPPNLPTAPQTPRIYLSCGTEDTLLPDTRSFHQHLQKLRIAHHYSELPGAHEWSLWDAEIQRVLAWLP